jgi:hypothetical protein
MFDITDLIYRVPDFLSTDECQMLIDEYELRNEEHNYERCPDANTGEDIYSTFKRITLEQGTDCFNLIHRKTEEAINSYLDYLEGFNSFHMPQLRKSFLYSHMYRLLKYDVGNKIHPHSDHDPYVYGSITFNLNDDYTGGNFKFFNGKHEVSLKKGEMMIWPADYFWVHEVTPVESGCRYSTNGFLLAVPKEIQEMLCNNVLVNKLVRNWQRSGGSGLGPYKIAKPVQ